MTAAFRTDWLATERAVFDCLSDIVGAVTVVKWAHDLKLCFTAAGAWCFINNVVTGMALVPAFFIWNILKSGVFFLEAELFRGPVHEIFSSTGKIRLLVWPICNFTIFSTISVYKFP